MKLLYVSAFLDLKEDRSSYRTISKSLDLFEPLEKSSINMICFISKNFKQKIDQDSRYLKSSNIKYVEIELDELETYKLVKSYEKISLPYERNIVKDTANFLILMNSKTEFIKKAMDIVDADYYAWLDFNICHVFKNINESITYLENIEKTEIKEKLLSFPGCWPKGTNLYSIYDRINWRFCGGFFIADKKSVIELHSIVCKYIEQSLKNGKITWETNLWALAEIYSDLKIDWYLADHNDSIIKFI
jgi:hypothetical protein